MKSPFFFGILAPCLAVNSAVGGDSSAPPLPLSQGPSALPTDATMATALSTRWKEMPTQYRARTRHVQKDGSPKFTNRLFLETSPYLLQHAHNPVNWYPWGDEAFQVARETRRPVLLSVGYSTCHWCHVMEEESFEDLEIAGFLNENYVTIKVDREERPDVDAIYMTAVQAIAGRGGWPMTVWLTADRAPFYGGTYFPPRDGVRGARVGFLSMLQQFRRIYDEQPERVTSSATQLTEAVRKNLSAGAPTSELPGVAVLDRIFETYRGRYDPKYGGLRPAPKFPSSLPIRFLLRQHRRTGDANALSMAVRTLDRMARGGMYDQVGGGFHRYSTDGQWLVPHFEKMLYDNALLTMAYLEAYQVTGREDFARVVQEIMRYVERDMTSPEGAFYSATDADSPNPHGEREEGWFFTWTPEELADLLTPEMLRVVTAYHPVTPTGNFEGRNILHAPRPLQEVADQEGLASKDLLATLREAHDILYEARAERPPPIRDDKILTAWNGLMIGAHAFASRVLDQPDYATRASRAADFVLAHLRVEGRLRRAYKDGRAPHEGYLDDYAFLVAGLIELFEATGERRWLEEAVELDRTLERWFEDTVNGGFFMTASDQPALLAREKPSYDGAEPSGNSVHTLNLMRLHEFTTEDRYRQRAEAILKAFGARLERSPTALSEMTLALDWQRDQPREIALVLPPTGGDAAPFLQVLAENFLPNRVVVMGKERADADPLLPWAAGKPAQNGRVTAYVCEHGICDLPTNDPSEFANQLKGISTTPGG